MRLHGTLMKSGRVWLAEVPDLDAMTQGKNRDDALRMIKSWVRDILGRQDLPILVEPESKGDGFTLTCPEAGPMVALLLRRKREAAGLSLAEVAVRLGAKSRNAYARYEQGQAVPTLEKLDQLLTAIEPDHGGFLLTCG